MSAATQAKNAKERANIAARFIRRGSTDSRAFDDCFECGDGDAVVSALLAKDDLDGSLTTYAMRAGWLDMTHGHISAPTYHYGPLEVIAHDGRTLTARTFDRSQTFRIHVTQATALSRFNKEES
jgi:hypothetical protein